MDKITGDTPNTEIKIWPMENCRFAYTLGNSQPVRCTWISEQPLFYSDCDDIMEDDYLLDDPVLESLERDIADLREKTNAYDKISQGFVEPENYTQSLFRDDAASISKSYKSKKSTLPQLLETLQKSRLASQFISFAQLHNVSIRETSQIVVGQRI
jgi:hypothetical protein